MDFDPEIKKGDPLFECIVSLIVAHKPTSMLEIGSADGRGSTQAFITGIQKASLENTSKLYCIEANLERFKNLVKETEKYPFICCINASSIPVEDYIDDIDINLFWMTHGYSYNIIRCHSIKTVKKWRADEINLITESGIDQNGIDQAKMFIGEKCFDMVLIDGSAFAAEEEMERIIGAKIIVMDDTRDIKCHSAQRTLFKNKEYRVVKDDDGYRNGFTAFVKV